MANNLPARELVKKIAMDIGKEAVSHLRIMFPEAYERLPQKGISLRNHVHNQIMAALDTTDADEIEARLKLRAKRRRERHAVYERLRSDGKPKAAVPAPSFSGVGWR